MTNNTINKKARIAWVVRDSLRKEQRSLREKVVALEQERRAKIMFCLVSFLVVFVFLFIISAFTNHELYFSILCGSCFGAAASGTLYNIIRDTIPKRREIKKLRKLYQERDLDVLFLGTSGRKYFPETYEKYLWWKDGA